MLAFLGAPGPQELIIVFFVILLIFGGKKLPELAKGLGKGIREFKKASTETEEENESQTAETTTEEDTTKE